MSNAATFTFTKYQLDALHVAAHLGQWYAEACNEGSKALVDLGLFEDMGVTVIPNVHCFRLTTAGLAAVEGA